MNYTQKDYYTEIAYKEYNNFIYNKMIDFNLRDINRLKLVIDKFELIKYRNINYIYFKYKGDWLSILECEDEWFIVITNKSDKIKYYKCDQYDGVIYCLKDKGFI